MSRIWVMEQLYKFCYELFYTRLKRTHRATRKDGIPDRRECERFVTRCWAKHGYAEYVKELYRPSQTAEVKSRLYEHGMILESEAERNVLNCSPKLYQGAIALVWSQLPVGSQLLASKDLREIFCVASYSVGSAKTWLSIFAWGGGTICEDDVPHRKPHTRW